jgi:hypothetical protein
MARIRSVKPELRRDLTVAEWPREVRYAWVLLWGYLDDDGRGLDDLRLLVADLFPLDRDVSERKLDNWLKRMTVDSLHGTAPLCRYEVDGRRYLHAPKWNRSQRVSHPQPSKVPPCPMHEADTNGTGGTPERCTSRSGAAPEPFRPSRAPEGQGVKGARDQGGKGARVVPVDSRPSELPVPTDHGKALAHPGPTLELLERTGPYVPKIRAELAPVVDELLSADIPPAAIEQALAVWRTRKAGPGLLAHLVQDQLTPAQQQDPRFAGLLEDARSSA